MRKIHSLIAILFTLFSAHNAFAQSISTIPSNLDKQFQYYRVSKSTPLMFAHLDKTVYTNNEMIWFAAYLLSYQSGDAAKHTVLSAALISNNDQKLAAQSRFIMLGNLVNGNLLVPDSIPPGDYQFIAYTNHLVNGQPDAVFKQQISIKTSAQPAYDAELWIDSANVQAGQVQATIRVSSKTIPVKGAGISYRLGKNKQTAITGKAKTNEIGRYTVTLPQKSITATQHTLEIQVDYNKEVKTLRLPIPVKQQAADVKFYPEGGNLVAGMVNNIGWEVKTAAGRSLKTEAVLYNGEEAIDTIATDSFGMGNFSFMPQAGNNYTVKLLQATVDSVYRLPSALKEGVVLFAPNTLPKDTLRVRLISTCTGKFTMLVHNYSQLFNMATVKLSPKGSLIKVDLAEVPRGLTTITLLDSLQRPCAERLFFAHYDRRQSISISPDHAQYVTRGKVSISLKLKDAKGQPVKGIVSVACAEDGRYEIKNDNNIENYVYLQSAIDNLPLKDNLQGSAALALAYLNELMLVRGWTRYKWTDLVQCQAADTLKTESYALYNGVVVHISKRIKKPLLMGLLRDSVGLSFLSTDSSGHFKLYNNQLYAYAGKKVQLMVNGETQDYQITVNDPYTVLNQHMAQMVQPLLQEYMPEQNTKNLSLKGFEHATHLKEVVIHGNGDGFYHAVANACGDYVCMYNILNCPNHVGLPSNHLPLAGNTYRSPQGYNVVYQGCDVATRPGVMAMDGIYAAKEFYVSNYDQFSSSVPDYLSTIYWKPRVLINQDKPTVITFNTSDITGKFRIVVQGITNDDVVYGEQTFTVKK